MHASFDKDLGKVNNKSMQVAWWIAFLGGVGSFFSPCVLPLVPSFLIYVSGATINQYSDLSDRKYRKRILLHSLSFIVGFSVVFMSLGLSSSLLGDLFSSYQRWIMAVGGVLLILMGLNMVNLLKIPFLNQEKMVHLKERPMGLVGSFFVGVTFSLGWTPCIGPILASILLIASSSRSAASGAYLLGLYSLGLALPFFVAALLVSRLMNLMQRFGYIVRYTSFCLGVLLILLGLLLVSGYYTAITRMLG
jgi:cytochrome c-type biogenesis protein